MRKKVYENILKLAENPSDKEASSAIIEEIRNPKTTCLTIKDYQKEEGLSNFIHKDIDTQTHVYQFQGLLGRGLNLKSEGKFVAFSAGTGILVFLDLVAHLILRIVSENGGPPELLGMFDTEDKLNLESFKFELYTSFANEEEAIGLEMARALESLRDKFEEK